MYLYIYIYICVDYEQITQIHFISTLLNPYQIPRISQFISDFPSMTSAVQLHRPGGLGLAVLQPDGTRSNKLIHVEYSKGICIYIYIYIYT